MPTFMKTSSNVVRDTPKLENPNLSLCSVCRGEEWSKGGRKGEREIGRGRERGKEGRDFSYLVHYGVVNVLFSRSSVSRRVGKCWLEVKGRRKVSSALTSEAS